MSRFSRTTATSNSRRGVLRRLATAAVLTATVSTGTLAVTNPAGAATSNPGLEQQVLELTNQHRATVGCEPLVGEARLAQSARAHSVDMADNDYMAHTDRQGRGPSERISATGYDWTRTAENVAAGSSTAEAVVQQWLNSPGHRANIENCALTQIGIGHGHNPDARFGHYWTQKFATPVDPTATIPLNQPPTPQPPTPQPEPEPAPVQVPNPPVVDPGPATFDSFAAPVDLGSVMSGAVSGDNTGSTLEAGEAPVAGVSGNSVHYTIVAPVDGYLGVSTAGSTYDTVLGIGTGTSVADMAFVAENDDHGGELTSMVVIEVTAGQTYRIVVGGFAGAEGRHSLGWAFMAS